MYYVLNIPMWSKHMFVFPPACHPPYTPSTPLHTSINQYETSEIELYA